MKRYISVILFVCALQLALTAQDKRGCSTDEMFWQLVEEDPAVLAEHQKLEEFTKQFTANYQQKSGVVKIIPVVFHIIHNYGAENIDDQIIYDGLKIINDDFRKLNLDTSQIVAAFKGIAADCDIEFRLAQKDPFGNCTNGITRTVSTQTYSADNGIKSLVRWPNDMYLNVWLAQNLANGAGGYAYYPGAGPSIDGIVVRISQFGLNQRTLTHELGHYLNLRHTWGNSNNAGDPSNCFYDDLVGDTPNTVGNTVCDLSVVSCSSLDNVQNYMEYAFCDRMFTEGQKTRMQAALNSSAGNRNNLWTASNLAATGTNIPVSLCTVDFTAVAQVVCEGSEVTFTDLSFNGQTGWSWYFEGGTPSYSSEKNPVITYNTAGEYYVGLSITNGTDIIADTKQSFIKVQTAIGDPMPFYESFEDFNSIDPDWQIINVDGENTWGLVDFVSFSGNNSMKMDNFSGNELGRKDEIISTAIDLTDMQSVDIDFQVAFAQKIDTTVDFLKVYISDDCGLNWALRWVSSGSNLSTAPVQSGSSFVPASSSDWTQQTVGGIDGTYLTNQFKMKFEFTNGGGNNLFLDDINISGTSNTVPMLVSPVHTLAEVSLNPTLDWNAVANVDFYEYEVDSNASFSSPAKITGTLNYVSNSNSGTDTELGISGLESNTSYYWRVRTKTSNVYSGWSAVWKFTTITQTGLYEQEQIKHLSIFPNPSGGTSKLVFLITGNTKVVITVTDMLGKQTISVFTGTLDSGSHEYLIPNLTTGIYMVKLETETQVLVQRFVKI